MRGWLICIVLIASFGLMGFSFAFLHNPLLISGTTVTGSAGARFVDNFRFDAELVERDSARLQGFAEESDVFFTAVQGRNGNISIIIEDAYPGDVYKLYYAVENIGSAPLAITLEEKTSGEGLSLNNKWDGHYTDDVDSLLPGEILPGMLVISVGQENPEETPSEAEYRHYEILVELHYELRGLK